MTALMADIGHFLYEGVFWDSGIGKPVFWLVSKFPSGFSPFILTENKRNDKNIKISL